MKFVRHGAPGRERPGILDAEGNVVDAQAVPVPDLDEQMLRDWAGY